MGSRERRRVWPLARGHRAQETTNCRRRSKRRSASTYKPPSPADAHRVGSAEGSNEPESARDDDLFSMFGPRRIVKKREEWAGCNGSSPRRLRRAAGIAGTTIPSAGTRPAAKWQREEVSGGASKAL